jgi:hypothetical protein
MLRWLFSRRQPPPEVEPSRILVRVIGILSPGFARVIVGPGIGMLDGGLEQDWPLEWLPLVCHRPNAEIWLLGPPTQPLWLEPVESTQDATG